MDDSQALAGRGYSPANSTMADVPACGRPTCCSLAPCPLACPATSSPLAGERHAIDSLFGRISARLLPNLLGPRMPAEPFALSGDYRRGRPPRRHPLTEPCSLGRIPTWLDPDGRLPFTPLSDPVAYAGTERRRLPGSAARCGQAAAGSR
jgi:hypothetical protein